VVVLRAKSVGFGLPGSFAIELDYQLLVGQFIVVAIVEQGFQLHVSRLLLALFIFFPIAYHILS